MVDVFSYRLSIRVKRDQAGVNPQFFSVFGAGVGTVPWLLLGELCPSKVKGIASGVTVSVAFVMIFAVVKIFPYGLEYLSPAGTYGFFAGVRH